MLSELHADSFKTQITGIETTQLPIYASFLNRGDSTGSMDKQLSKGSFNSLSFRCDLFPEKCASLRALLGERFSNPIKRRLIAR